MYAVAAIQDEKVIYVSANIDLQKAQQKKDSLSAEFLVPDVLLKIVSAGEAALLRESKAAND